MRTIIAGSRTCTDKEELVKAINNCGWKPTVVISGAAKGVDKLGELWAEENGISCQLFPADWKLYGKSAGWKRNYKMACKAEALIAIWDGKSKGTKNMIDIARLKKLKVHIHMIENNMH